MKKLLSISLVLVLFANLLVGMGAYVLLRWQVREAMEAQLKQSLADKDLALVIVDKSNQHEVSFSWFSDDEFSYRGHMYDISRKEQHGNKTYYYCLDDSREALLNQQLDHQVVGFGHKAPRQPNQSFNWFSSTYLVYLCPSTVSMAYFMVDTPAVVIRSSNMAVHIPQTITPPPETAV